MEEYVSKHELLIGKKKNAELVNAMVAGQAFQRTDENYFTVKIMMFPGQTYYLVKNREGNNRYTVFSKLVKTQESTKFQNPVGAGRLSAELPEYMEIYFPVLRTQMFLCLYPENK
jgi:hypothetical protein